MTFSKRFIWSGLSIAILAGVLYLYLRTPAGIVPMGDNTEKLAKLALYSSVVGLVTAIVGLVKAMIEKK